MYQKVTKKNKSIKKINKKKGKIRSIKHKNILRKTRNTKYKRRSTRRNKIRGGYNQDHFEKLINAIKEETNRFNVDGYIEQDIPFSFMSSYGEYKISDPELEKYVRIVLSAFYEDTESNIKLKNRIFKKMKEIILENYPVSEQTRIFSRMDKIIRKFEYDKQVQKQKKIQEQLEQKQLLEEKRQIQEEIEQKRIEKIEQKRMEKIEQFRLKELQMRQKMEQAQLEQQKRQEERKIQEEIKMQEEQQRQEEQKRQEQDRQEAKKKKQRQMQEEQESERRRKEEQEIEIRREEQEQIERLRKEEQRRQLKQQLMKFEQQRQIQKEQKELSGMEKEDLTGTELRKIKQQQQQIESRYHKTTKEENDQRLQELQSNAVSFWIPFFQNEFSQGNDDYDELFRFKDNMLWLLHNNKICSIIEEEIPTYATMPSNIYQGYGMTSYNLDLCLIFIIMGILSKKIKDDETQKYNIVFKGGKGVQLASSLVPNAQKYQSDDVDIFFLPKDGISYNRDEQKELASNIGYLIHWILPSLSIKISPHHNPDIVKISMEKEDLKYGDFKALADMDFKELPKSIKPFFSDISEFQVTVPKYNMELLFAFPTLQALLNEKTYYLIDYSTKHDDAVHTQDIRKFNDSLFHLEKIYRALKALLAGLVLQESPGLSLSDNNMFLHVQRMILYHKIAELIQKMNLSYPPAKIRGIIQQVIPS
jgi:hypothetical protein